MSNLATPLGFIRFFPDHTAREGSRAGCHSRQTCDTVGLRPAAGRRPDLGAPSTRAVPALRHRAPRSRLPRPQESACSTPSSSTGSAESASRNRSGAFRSTSRRLGVASHRQHTNAVAVQSARRTAIAVWSSSTTPSESSPGRPSGSPLTRSAPGLRTGRQPRLAERFSCAKRGCLSWSSGRTPCSRLFQQPATLDEPAC